MEKYILITRYDSITIIVGNNLRHLQKEKSKTIHSKTILVADTP